MIDQDIIDSIAGELKDKANDIQKIEYKNIVLYEKSVPWYNGKIFAVPIKYLLTGFILYNILKR